MRFHRPGRLGRYLHYLGVSAFSRYTVAAQESLIKIEPDLPLEKAALFGCAVLTGVGCGLEYGAGGSGRVGGHFWAGWRRSQCLDGGAAGRGAPDYRGRYPAEQVRAGPPPGSDPHDLNALDGDPVRAIRDLTDGGVEYAFEAVGQARVLSPGLRGHPARRQNHLRSAYPRQGKQLLDVPLCR